MVFLYSSSALKVDTQEVSHKGSCVFEVEVIDDYCFYRQ